MVFEQSWWGSVTNVWKMTCETFGRKKNWSWFGFGFAKLGRFAFCALLAKLLKKWNHGLWAILVENCHKCIQNKVSNVWLRKEMIFVGFWLSQVGWIVFLYLGSKIVEKLKSWCLNNLEGKVSQLYAKWGVKLLAAKGIHLGWVFA